MPFSPSKKVILLFVEPVFLKPVSKVTKPVRSLNFEISMAFSSSVPVITGNSIVLPSTLISAISDILLYCVYSFLNYIKLIYMHNKSVKLI
ncbi:hypothetical protein D3C72_2217890 [compost metagenome]